MWRSLLSDQIKSQERIKELGEVFTPSKLVLKMLAHLPRSVWQEGKTFIDPSCGNGNFLIEVAKRKKHRGHKIILETIFGVDIMPDNVAECKTRLLEIVGDTESNRRVVDKNIVCADGTTYDFSFGEQS
jgi:type I restriction-modification system DNA methylase subunit